MSIISNLPEIEQSLGKSIESLRLQKNIDRQTLAKQAGVSVSAIRHLEAGQGANIKTLIRVVKALGRADWFAALAPKISINPLHAVHDKPRQRARKRRVKNGNAEQ